MTRIVVIVLAVIGGVFAAIVLSETIVGLLMFDEALGLRKWPVGLALGGLGGALVVNSLRRDRNPDDTRSGPREHQRP